MDPETPLTKAQRLQRISAFLYRHPRGLTAGELARLCGVHARTIQRDLRDLEDTGVPLTDNDSTPPRYSVIEGYYIPPVHLELGEAVALYMAARLLSRHPDAAGAPIADALAKLATILPEPIAAHVHGNIQELASREQDTLFTRVFGTLILAWAGGRAVRIRYRGSDNATQEYTLYPYLLEPSGTYGSVYVIGHCCERQALRTFKVERVLEARLLPETFDVPADFSLGLLDSAWGVMYGEETNQVALRFNSSATWRIKETHWHRSQILEELPDGGCVLRVWVAHPEEMTYWVRGWGPQVEVLEPDWLRAQIAAEARQLAGLYAGDAARR